MIQDETEPAMQPTTTQTIDLRPVGLAERNTLATRRFAALAPGDVLELVLDSPPWVLYHQLRTDRLGEFDWELAEQGPERFVVRLRKLA